MATTVASDAAFKEYVEGLTTFTTDIVYMNDNSKYWTFTRQQGGKINAMCVTSDNVELWMYDGTDWLIKTGKKIHVTTPSITSLPVTFYCSAVTSKMLIDRVVLSNKSAMSNDWNLITNDGSIRIEGTLSSGTNTVIDVDLYEPDATYTATTTE